MRFPRDLFASLRCRCNFYAVWRDRVKRSTVNLARSFSCSTSIWHCLYVLFAQRKKNGRLPERENRPGVKLFSTPVLPRDVIRRISLYPSCLDKSGAWETPEISTHLSLQRKFITLYTECVLSSTFHSPIVHCDGYVRIIPNG